MTCPRAGPNQVSYQLTSGAVLSYAFSLRGFFHPLLDKIQKILSDLLIIMQSEIGALLLAECIK